jgi:hypothetical protein
MSSSWLKEVKERIEDIKRPVTALSQHIRILNKLDSHIQIEFIENDNINFRIDPGDQVGFDVQSFSNQKIRLILLEKKKPTFYRRVLNNRNNLVPNKQKTTEIEISVKDKGGWIYIKDIDCTYYELSDISKL